MIVSELRLYELLKAKLGTQEAEAFVEILEQKVDQKFDDTKQTLATKQDISDLRTELKVDIANSKADMIKWMFIFWLGQLAASVTIVKYFFGK
jgi:hypothetical protein